jgi:hypothetical protein
MNTAIKFIMHGLASGRVKSTPQVLDALKELSCGHQGFATGSNNFDERAKCKAAGNETLTESGTTSKSS